MEMSDDDRDSRCSSTKKARYDSDSLKEENDSLRCQIDAMRNEMFLNRSELRQDSDFREKQIKVLQETIRNMQTQLLQTKMRQQRDAKSIEQLERDLKEARVRALLLQTKIKEARNKQKEYKISSSSNASIINEESIPNSIEEKLTHESNDEQETENNQIFVETEKSAEKTIAEIQVLVDDNEKVNLFDSNKIDDITDVDRSVCVDNSNKDGDDVHIVSVKQREISGLNGVTSQQTLTLMLDDNDIVLVEEEEEKNETVEATKAVNNVQFAEASNENLEDSCEEETKDITNVPEIENVEISKNKNYKQTTEHFKSLEHFEARIIALVAAYLVVQPFGACSSSICSYLSNFIKSNELEVKPLEEILRKYENLFMAIEPEVSGNQACNDQKEQSIQLKWKFCGFVETKTTTTADLIE